MCTGKPDSHGQNILIEHCRREEPVMGGVMWRLSGTSQKPDRMNNSNWKTYPVHYHFKLTRRTLSADETMSVITEEVVDLGVKAFNENTNLIHMFKSIATEDAEIQLQPAERITFVLFLEETKCKKNGRFLDDVALMRKECPSSNSTEPMQRCSFTLENKNELGLRTVELGDCHKWPADLYHMVNTMRPMKENEKRGPLFSTLIQEIAEQYNMERGDSLLYEVRSLKNLLVKVKTGEKITADVTLEATNCRMPIFEPCFNAVSPKKVECKVVIWKRPWLKSSHSISFSNCWKLVKTTDKFQATWKEAMEPTQVQIDEIVQQAVQKFNSLRGHDEMSVHRISNTLLQIGRRNFVRLSLCLKGDLAAAAVTCCQVEAVVNGTDKDNFAVSISKCHEKREELLKLAGGQQNVQREATNLINFQAMLSRVVEAHNGRVNDLFYRRLDHFEDVTTQVVTGTKMAFKIFLLKTNCMKNKHTGYIEDESYDKCGPVTKPHLIQCDVEVWQKLWEKSETISFGQCIEGWPNENPITFVQPLNYDVESTDNFNLLVERAVSVFNTQTDHPVICERLAVENVTTKRQDGMKYKFTLYLKPNSMKPKRQNEFPQTALRKFYNFYAIRCQVSVWQTRELLATEHHTIEDCEFIDPPVSTLRSHVDITESRLPNRATRVLKKSAVELFDASTNAKVLHKGVYRGKTENRIAGGNLTTVHIELVPSKCRLQTGGSEQDTEVGTDCTESLPQYSIICEVRSWKNPWRGNREELEITCTNITYDVTQKIQFMPTTGTTAVSPQYIDKVVPKLVHMFNEEVGGNGRYEKQSVTNVKQQFVAGPIITFDLILKPEDASRNALRPPLTGQKRAQDIYQCRATVLMHPWNQTEVLNLEECFPTESPKTGPEEATQKMESREDEKILEDLASKAIALYNSRANDSHVYGKDKILNPTKQVVVGERIQFQLVMKPIACKLGVDKEKCRAESGNDKVECEAVISEPLSPGGMTWLSLNNCRMLWSPQSERGLTEAEMKTSWLQKAVLDALKLHQSMSKSNYLYKVHRIESGSLKRDEVEQVNFQLVLTETECRKKQDETKLFEGAPTDCPEKRPQVLKECQVLLTRRPNSSHELSLSCET
ncbi:unnamed protein product [Calicophoron daubneyi]